VDDENVAENPHKTLVAQKDEKDKKK